MSYLDTHGLETFWTKIKTWVNAQGFTKNTGTVTTTGTMTSGHVVTSNGGTVIKDSGYTIAANVPSGAVFTDAKVTQTVTNSSNTSKRPLLLGMSYSDATPASFSNVTDTAYAAHNAWVKPVDGIIGAKQIQIADSVSLVYDSTNKCLNFNFS